MKKLKGIIAVLMSVSMAASTFTTVSVPSAVAAEVSTIYNKTYVELFDDAETVFGDDGLIEYANDNATEETVTVTEHTQGGSCLKIDSGESKLDVQVATKKGVFKHDVTVVDMWLNATSVSPFPQIKLICDGIKLGENQANGILTFTGGQQWRAYDLNTPSDYISNNAGNTWIPVRIILDSVNKTVTTNVYGSQMSKVTELSESWDNAKTQLNFQTANGSALMIDNLVISDGTYMTDVYMEYDFEHSNTINAEVSSNFFYGINKVQNPKVVYDEEGQNTYLDIANAAGNTIYTNSTFNMSAGKPIVVEFRMKTDETSDVSVIFRKSSSLVPGLFTINDGILTEGTKTVNVADGNFHTYRATFTPSASGAGYSISKLVDGNWIGTAQGSSGDYTGTGARVDFRPSAGTCAIDDFTMYFPQQPKLMCDIADKTDVSTDSVIELVSNTRINASTATKVTITANGNTVTYNASSDGAKNSYIFEIDGGLQPDTTYVITTGSNGLRDFYDQFYNTEITFKTLADGEATEIPTETVTEAPTEEVTESPTEEETEAPTEPVKVFNKTYEEHFDDAETVFGDDGLVEYANDNATEETVTVPEHTQGGSYLKIDSGESKLDVQVATKKGIFKHDITVVDMWLNATSVSPFPQIKLVCDGVKLGENQANGILTFTGGQQWRAYNLNTPSDYISNNAGNTWIPVRIILDSVNKTVTTNVYGSQMSKVTELSDSWDNAKTQLNFQAANGSALMIDNLVISDGTYMTDVYMEYDFEHSSTINAEVGSNFFYGINKLENPTVVFDEASGNTYLDIANAAGNTIYTNSTLNMSAGKPIVVEFRMKTDETSDVSVIFRKSSSLVPGLFTITDGILTEGTKTVGVADGKFHTYRATFTPNPSGEGYSISKLVDGNWIGTAQGTTGDYTGTGARVDFRPSAGTCAIDNVTIYLPQQPKLMCDIADRTDVSTDRVIELVSNTLINASTATKVTITANGDAVGYKASSDGAKNSYIFEIDGGLQPDTTYVITTGSNGLRDFYDQFYNAEITFKTLAEGGETEAPTEQPTDTPTEKPTESVTAKTVCKINGTDVTDGKLITGTMECAITVETDMASDKIVTAYVAQYNEYGALTKLLPLEFTLDSAEPKTKRAISAVTEPVKSVKVFVWKANQVPVGNMTELVR